MDIHDIHNISTTCTRTEFVGTAVLDTIGLVISGVDDSLLQQMNVDTKYHCLGLFSSRTGAAGQITAIDDAVKATNTEVLSIELPRDTKGWGGHGNYIVLGGNDVSDVRHAISLALELTNKNAGEVYISESGHLEFAFSANASILSSKPAVFSFTSSSSPNIEAIVSAFFVTLFTTPVSTSVERYTTGAISLSAS